MKQSHWLKGGIAGIILGPIVWFCMLKLTIPTSVEVREFPLDAALMLGLIVYGSAAAIGFIAGSIIGWIYGKIKDTKWVGLRKFNKNARN